MLPYQNEPYSHSAKSINEAYLAGMRRAMDIARIYYDVATMNAIKAEIAALEKELADAP